MPARCEFRLLGAVEARVSGRPLQLGSKKQRALLACLLLRRNVVVTRGEIMQALWGEEPPRTADSIVQTYVSGLRQADRPSTALRDRLVTVGNGYRLDVADEELDVGRFQSRLEQAREAAARGAWPAAAAQAGLALQEWEGAPLADLDDEPVAAEAGHLATRLRVEATCLWAEAELELGRPAAVLEPLQRMAGEFPLDEAVCRLLMLAFYRTGRQAEALRRFEQTRRLLADDLGVDPGAALRQLHAEILSQAPGLATVPTKDPTWYGPRGPSEPLIGRDQEVERLLALLAAGERLVSLTGAAGCGKTRLAYELAQRVWEGRSPAELNCPDGVAVVELAGLTDPELLPSTVAATLQLRERLQGDATDAVVEALRQARLLLVLDNCEHLLTAGAALIERVLRSCPGVAVVTTTREAIGLGEESARPVPPLAVPPVGEIPSWQEAISYPAVRLMVERARRHGSALLRPDDVRAVTEICRRLDGIPLALELAAARLTVLTPDELSARLDDRFRLLVGGRRTSLARHQTLRAALDWSFRLLESDEQRALLELSVFPSSFGLEAAATVLGRPAATALDLISSLVSKSLLDVGRVGESSRYRMLESIRQYAQELDTDVRAGAMSRFSPTTRRRSPRRITTISTRPGRTT